MVFNDQISIGDEVWFTPMRATDPGSVPYTGTIMHIPDSVCYDGTPAPFESERIFVHHDAFNIDIMMRRVHIWLSYDEAADDIKRKTEMLDARVSKLRKDFGQ